MVSRNTTLVPSLGLRTGPACEAGLSAGMRRERVSPQKRKKEKRMQFGIRDRQLFVSSPIHVLLLNVR